MKDEILDFISRRFADTACNWIDGNCFWFARILQVQFGNQSWLKEIYYHPIEGHFTFFNGVAHYDYNGIYETEGPYYSMALILSTDIELYKRLLRDCVE